MNWIKYKKLVLILFFAICVLSLSISAQEYGFMYLANKAAPASVASGTWYTVGSTSGNEFSEGITSDNWSYSTNKLTAGGDLPSKVYLVKFSLSFGAAVATWQIGISKNGAEPSIIISQRTISSPTKDAGVVSGLGYLSLTASDEIELKVKQTTGSAIAFDPYHAQVVIVEMTDSSPNYYGGMYIEANSTEQSGIGTSYTTVSGFGINSQKNGWTFSSDELTAGGDAAGIYLVSFSASYAGKGNDNAPETFDIGIAQGSSGDPSTIITRRKTSAADVGNIYGCGLLNISVSEALRLEIKAAKNNAYFTPYYSSISLYKISGTTTAPRGHMVITNSDQTISDNNYTTVTGFSEGTQLNDWTFSSENNSLNATEGTQSAGSYIVDYKVSFQKKTSSESDPTVAAFSIFLDNTEQTELTIKRKLSGGTDVGAAGGTGIINISSASTKVYLKIKNETNTNDLSITSASVNLHRFVDGSHDGSLPVELTDFNAENWNSGVLLTWTTESEIENLGFVLERRDSKLDTGNWEEIAGYLTNAVLEGHGSTTGKHEYQYTDKTVQSGKTYEYRLGDVDYNGKVTWHKTVEITVDAESVKLPVEFGLHKAYPNPFNPSVILSYGLKDAGQTTLQVYNMRGQMVETLVNTNQIAGNYDLKWQPVNLSAGVYIVRLQSGNQTNLQKIVFVK